MVKIVSVLALLALVLGAAPAYSAEIEIEELVVRASLLDRLGETGSWGVLDADEIAAIGATHVNESLARVPGVWISRGSGQEHLTAIRSAAVGGGSGGSGLSTDSRKKVASSSTSSFSG